MLVLINPQGVSGDIILSQVNTNSVVNPKGLMHFEYNLMWPGTKMSDDFLKRSTPAFSFI